MNKRILTCILTLAMLFSGLIGLSTAVNADDEHYHFSFYNGNTSGNTSGVTKSTSKKVYIHPTSDPANTYTVYN